MTRLGTFYGVGVGPGDPEQLTLKAIRVIGETPVICAPKVPGSRQSFVLSLVRDYIDDTRQEILLLRLPKTTRSAELTDALVAAYVQIEKQLAEGTDVALLTLGDPMLYSLYPYFRDKLKKNWPELTCAVVPGISSVSLASARTGLELAFGSGKLAIAPLGSDMQQAAGLLTRFEVVVFVKVDQAFDDFLSLLIRMGLEKSAVLISRCGTSEESIVDVVTSMQGKKLDYLSLVMVQNRSAASQKIGWW